MRLGEMALSTHLRSLPSLDSLPRSGPKEVAESARGPQISVLVQQLIDCGQWLKVSVLGLLWTGSAILEGERYEAIAHNLEAAGEGWADL